MRQFALITLALVVCLVDTAFGEVQSMASNEKQINKVVAGGSGVLIENDTFVAQAQANSKRGLLDNGGSGSGDLTGSLTKGIPINGLLGGGGEQVAQTESARGQSGKRRQ